MRKKKHLWQKVAESKFALIFYIVVDGGLVNVPQNTVGSNRSV